MPRRQNVVLSSVAVWCRGPGRNGMGTRNTVSDAMRAEKVGRGGSRMVEAGAPGYAVGIERMRYDGSGQPDYA